jgi:hypothetical protein
MPPPKDPEKYKLWKERQDKTRPKSVPPLTEEQNRRRRASISLALTGKKKNAPNSTKGKTLVEIHGEERAAVIITKLIKTRTGRTSGMKGKIPHNKGKWESENRGGAKDLAWIAAVLNKDNFICQSCGITEEEEIKKVGKGLHAHHVKPWKAFPKLRFVVSNGSALCNTCHPKEEAKTVREEIPLETS